MPHTPSVLRVSAFMLRLSVGAVQVHMFTAFQLRIDGELAPAHRHVLQMLLVLAKNSRENCTCCGRARSEVHAH